MMTFLVRTIALVALFSSSALADTISVCGEQFPITSTTIRCGGMDAGTAVPVEIEKFRALERLELIGMELTDCSVLARTPWIRALSFRGTTIKDASCINSIRRLKRLDLRDAQLTTLSGVADLKVLEELYVPSRVTDLRPLSALGRLKHLDLSHTSISNLKPLKKLKSLVKLSLHNAKQLRDAKPLRWLVRLRELNLANTKIQSVSWVRALPKLRHLDLSGTPVEDVRSVAALQDLRYLDLSATEVKSLTTLSDLDRLETLRLDFTMIDDVRALRPLKTLKKLGLAEVELSTMQMNGLKKSLPRCTIER